MLTIYRRHLTHCAHRTTGRKYRHCRCPIWVDGIMDHNRIGRSLRTKDWQRAQGIIRDWEAEARITEPDKAKPMAIAEACATFESDAQARKLNEATIYKYKLLFRRLQDFAAGRGLRYLVELDVETLTAFRADWKDGPRSSLKKLERLRAFFRFAGRRKWVESNPAAELEPPQVTIRPTMPFTAEEMMRILGAVDSYAEQTAHNGRLNAHRLRALVLLLRYSGMRIGDAVGLAVDRLNGRRLFLYTAKTGVPVHVVLPEHVVRVLEFTPRASTGHFFWSGQGKLATAVRVWETRLRRLFQLAELPGGHAHRFRDTFAVELLLAGVPIERVSVLLGHQGIRVTERHYAPWVRSRQEQLEADLERAWSQDALLLLETNATPALHGKDRLQ